MLKKILSVILMMVGGVSFAVTEEEALVARYQQARIAVSYKGNVGDLAQQLAQQLNIPYYAEQHQPTVQIRIKQDNTKNINNLLEAVNAQLSNQKLRFDILDDKVVLALTGNNIKTLLTPQFIGEIVFEPSSISNQVETSPTEELNVKDSSSTDSEVKQENTTLSLQDVAPVQKAVESTSENEVDQEAKKLQSILEMSKDEQLLAQYAKRKQPVFSVADKKSIALETIRSTKISTFLIFEDNVDTREYKFDGNFQDIARLDNVVAILHRQKSPPRTFTVETPAGVKQVINRMP